MNSPSPFTPIQAIQDEQREGWVAESKPLDVQLVEKDAQILALREALQQALPILDRDKDLNDAEIQLCGPMPIARRKALRACQAALSTPPPPVVPLEDVKPLLQILEELAEHDALTAQELKEFYTKHPTTK